MSGYDWKSNPWCWAVTFRVVTDARPEVKHRPILFSGEMVRAILDRRKTQTRRPVRGNRARVPVTLADRKAGLDGAFWAQPGGWVRCPFGAPGDSQTCVVHGADDRKSVKRSASAADPGITERRLPSGGGWSDLLSDEVRGLRAQDSGGLVSLERPRHSEGLSNHLAVSRESKGDRPCPSTGVHGVSRAPADASPSGAAPGRRFGQQPADESCLGDATGELERPESARPGLRGREASRSEAKRRGARSSTMVAREGALLDPSYCEDAGDVTILDSGRCSCPPRLWVRETWAPADLRYSPLAPVLYRADGDAQPVKDERWRPSIHMPRWASRLTLEVVDVRVQRLQEISEADARAEGVEPCGGFMATAGCWRNYGSEGPSFGSARESYRSLWDSIYGARPPSSRRAA